MKNNPILDRQSEIFQTVISFPIRIQAETFRRYHASGNKAKQVYLNTLAVSVVNSYLHSIGWSTDLQASDSWNPLLQTMLNVADLQIPSYGKLECRWLMEEDDCVLVPPEVWSERIGYMVVQLSRSLDQASLLGFFRQVNHKQMPLTQLESLVEFPMYLSQQRHVAPISSAILSNWLGDHQEPGWHQLEDLCAPQFAVNFRSPQQLADHTPEQLSSQTNRVKLIHLEPEQSTEIALMLQVQSLPDIQEFNISLIVFNSQAEHRLPEGLEVIIYDTSDHPVMIAQASETETIEFCFSGKLGERFNIEVALDEHSQIENFII